MHTLLWRLEGPMQSWGTSSRFTQRDTGPEPSKPGVIGLLSTALGKPRRGGTLDGQRCGVAQAHGGLFESVMSHRFFLQDASFLVGLAGPDRDLLQRLYCSQLAPVWPRDLGRKDYVPGMPPAVKDELVDLDLEQALESAPLSDRADDEIRVVLEVDHELGTEPRLDQPLDFARRRFGRRYVQVVPLAALAGR